MFAHQIYRFDPPKAICSEKVHSLNVPDDRTNIHLAVLHQLELAMMHKAYFAK